MTAAQGSAVPEALRASGRGSEVWSQQRSGGSEGARSLHSSGDGARDPGASAWSWEPLGHAGDERRPRSSGSLEQSLERFGGGRAGAREGPANWRPGSSGSSDQRHGARGGAQNRGHGSQGPASCRLATEPWHAAMRSDPDVVTSSRRDEAEVQNFGQQHVSLGLPPNWGAGTSTGQGNYTGRSEQDAQAAVAEARFAHVEQRNHELAEEIRKLRADAESGQDEVRQAQLQWRDLQLDNERLLDLLSKMDTERTQLQRENALLITDIQNLHSSSSRETQRSAGQSSNAVEELKRQLKESELHRRHLEDDFQRLVDSLGSYNDNEDAASEQGESWRHLQQKLKEMEAENVRLTVNLESTRKSMARYQDEVGKISGSLEGQRSD
mmetsp:Transcript_14221/g.33661  ORF Transcript_14221/g.33661 Transcript_14221/m.33661 type:complete len:382 (+) Transcript_14221:196-1341(+)